MTIMRLAVNHKKYLTISYTQKFYKTDHYKNIYQSNTALKRGGEPDTCFKRKTTNSTRKPTLRINLQKLDKEPLKSEAAPRTLVAKGAPDWCSRATPFQMETTNSLTDEIKTTHNLAPLKRKGESGVTDIYQYVLKCHNISQNFTTYVKSTRELIPHS